MTDEQGDRDEREAVGSLLVHELRRVQTAILGGDVPTPRAVLVAEVDEGVGGYHLGGAMMDLRGPEDWADVAAVLWREGRHRYLVVVAQYAVQREGSDVLEDYAIATAWRPDGSCVAAIGFPAGADPAGDPVSVNAPASGSPTGPWPLVMPDLPRATEEHARAVAQSVLRVSGEVRSGNSHPHPAIAVGVGHRDRLAQLGGEVGTTHEDLPDWVGVSEPDYADDLVRVDAQLCGIGADYMVLVREDPVIQLDVPDGQGVATAMAVTAAHQRMGTRPDGDGTTAIAVIVFRLDREGPPVPVAGWTRRVVDGVVSDPEPARVEAMMVRDRGDQSTVGEA